MRRKVRRIPKLVRREVYERELEVSRRRAGLEVDPTTGELRRSEAILAI